MGGLNNPMGGMGGQMDLNDLGGGGGSDDEEDEDLPDLE